MCQSPPTWEKPQAKQRKDLGNVGVEFSMDFVDRSRRPCEDHWNPDHPKARINPKATPDRAPKPDSVVIKHRRRPGSSVESKSHPARCREVNEGLR